MENMFRKRETPIYIPNYRVCEMLSVVHVIEKEKKWSKTSGMG